MTRSLLRSTRSLLSLIAFATALLLLGAAPTQAQRGRADSSRVAGTPPTPVSLSGTVAKVLDRPCPQSSGRSPADTHLLLRTPEGSAHLHLGPTAALPNLRSALSTGAAVSVQAAPANGCAGSAYVALRVTVDGTTYRLRDPNTLRPRWAAERRGWMGCCGHHGQHHGHHHRSHFHGGCPSGGGWQK